jgi:predicted  nucleic acid-binding Zn-ribbon protein
MLKELEQLLVLQDRDKKLRALRQELKVAPLERKQLDDKLAAAQARLDAAKLRSKEIEVHRKGLENDAQSKRDQIAKYQVQKFQTRKNEEFQAISTAIQHLEDDVRKIEDSELGLMEETEALKPQIASAEADNQGVKTQVAGQVKDLDAKTAAVNESIRKLEAERAALVEGVEEDLLTQYERLFKTKGVGVVALEHDVCTGCHMKVTASTSQRTKTRREIVTCEQCGRILYWSEG